MNLSGKSIGALAGFYQIPTERILVVHDELDLSPVLRALKKVAVMAVIMVFEIRLSALVTIVTSQG